MKTENSKFACAYKGASTTATSLASQMQPDKAGAILVTNGFGKASFCLFLARLAIRAIEAGYDEKKLTLLFQAMDAGNASAAGKAAASIVITIDGKAQSLAKFWEDNNVTSEAVTQDFSDI